MIKQALRTAPEAEPATKYNYEAFDFSMEATEFQRWLQDAPAIGDRAPDFELEGLEGERVRLEDLRGRPVVLEFGSYTCPIFSDRVPAMEQLAREYPEATFLVVYAREAHPGEGQRQHRTLSDKRLAAHKLVVEEALRRRVLVDSVDGVTHRAYGGAWNPVYVIGPDGRVAMRQAWNHPQDVAAALNALRKGLQPEIAESTEMLREPSRAPTGQRLLERGGLHALEDFYRSAPPPVRESLRNSPSHEVRAAIASLEGLEIITVTSKDGTPIALWKTGRGPSLLVVHGTCADHSAWDRVVPLLSEDFSVYAMDRRGRGSSGDGSEYALEREVEDVVAAIESLPAPVYLYGHSFGGCCAVEAAARTAVDRLVLYEGGPKPAGLRLIPDEIIAQLEDWIQAERREEAVEMFMLNAAGVTPEELEVLRKQSSWPARVAAAHTIPRELRALNDYEADMEHIRAINTPVTLVVGEDSEPRRRELFENFSSLFKKVRVAILRGQRHAAHQTAPEVLADTLREFLLDRPGR